MTIRWSCCHARVGHVRGILMMKSRRAGPCCRYPQVRRLHSRLAIMGGMAERRPAHDLTESLDPVLDFMRLLWDIEHGLQSTSKRMRSTLGITGPQRLVLRVVSQFPGMSAAEAAHVVRLHPSTLTGVIQRLVDKGLLVRDRDPDDTRRMRLRVVRGARRYTRHSGRHGRSRSQDRAGKHARHARHPRASRPGSRRERARRRLEPLVWR